MTETSATPGKDAPIHADLPRHIAIIMDGNGRWAERKGLPRIEGHRRGVRTVRKIVEECCRLKIEQLTLYCLSSENWKRPKQELNFLMRLLRQYLIEERAEIIDQNIRFASIGRRSELPETVLNELDQSCQVTKDCSGMILCLAINYGARAEIVDAVQRIGNMISEKTLKPEDIDERLITDSLYTFGMTDPDLLIRSAGEQRLSNFLLGQISYAELWITPRLWPEFELHDLHEALSNFAQRDRRFGGLGG